MKSPGLHIDEETVAWFKSSFSSGSANCVEVAEAPGLHAIRDSKTLDQKPLLFGNAEWQAFLGTAQGTQL